MRTETTTYSGLMHAGAGTGLALVQLSAIIPGLLPMLALIGAFTAVLVVPVIVLGLLVAIAATPPFALWRLVTRRRADARWPAGR